MTRRRDPQAPASPSDPGSGVISFYRSECQEQPARLAALLQAYASDPDIRVALDGFKSAVAGRSPLLWLGMGASYASSLAGAMRMSLSGHASFAMEASEWLHYALPSWDQVAGPLLVTTSGESAELVELCRGESEHPKLLLSNSEKSTCSSLASLRLPILAGVERANATKTYINSTTACIIIASEITGNPWVGEGKQVKEAFAESLENVFRRRRELDEFSRGAKNIEVIGRGGGWSGAIMGALCVREMTKTRAVAHSGGAFRHGPSLDVDSTHLAIVLALGRAAELQGRLARECVARGGKVILVTDHREEVASDQLLSVHIEPVPEPWDALTSVLPSQALTLALMERLGSSYVRVQTTTE